MTTRRHVTTSRLTALATACLAALLAGCATPIAQSVVAANMAQEEAANQLLVLNIARAHEHMPMHFSLLGQIRSAPGGWGLGVPSFGFEIPFGGAAERKYTLTAGSEGQTPADVTPLTNQEFLRGMTNPLKPELLAYFAQHGWSKPMLMHLLIESVELVRVDDGAVVDRLQNDPGSPAYARFWQFVENASACDLVVDEGPAQPTYLSGVVSQVSLRDGVKIHAAKLELLPVTPTGDALPNDDAAKSSHVRLAAVSKDVVLRMSTPPNNDDLSTLCQKAEAYDGRGGMFLDPDQPAESTEGAPAPASAQRSPRSKTSVLAISLKPAGRDNAPTQAKSQKALLAPAKAKTDTHKPQFVLRSPQSVIYYLGQLSRVQNAGWYGLHPENGSGPLTIRVAEKKRAALFQMSSSGGAGPAAVSVQYAGHTFTVPRFDGHPNSALQDRSVSVLSLMMLLLGLQDKGSDAPGVSSVRLLR